MVKMLEMLGLVLVAIMTLGFVGVFESYGINKGTSPLFWGCAGAALMIIVYRKIKRKKEEKES
jgi:FtsH-binding integral membrane protein